MSWSPTVVRSLTSLFGAPESVHMPLPGTSLVDVAEFHRDDGTTVYATAGASKEGDRGATELVLRCAEPDPRLLNLMARIGPMVGQLGHGHTVPLAGPPDSPPPFEGVGIRYVHTMLVQDTRVRLLQVIGLTGDELEAARSSGLATVLTALELDGHGGVCSPGRETSSSLAELISSLPDKAELRTLTIEVQMLIDGVLREDHDRAETMRDEITRDDARQVAAMIGARLATPGQLATLLHSLMDHAVEELRVPCHRLLQLHPADRMAGQYYLDALCILAALDGGTWGECYERLSEDSQLIIGEGTALREKLGLPIRWGKLAPLGLPRGSHAG